MMSELGRGEIVIKKVETSDIDGIAALCSQLGYPCTYDEVAPRSAELMKNEEHIIFVAVNFDGKIVGWVHSYIVKLFYADKSPEIGGIVVDENYRGHGVGRKLMNAVEEWTERKGCSVVSLRSNSKRIEAHLFYNLIGYEKVKEQYTFRKYL
jgi:GNAT superfamily N-acetyltransferase